MGNTKFLTYTKIAFGWDSLIGLMPLAGDFLSLAASLYIVMESKKLGISKTIFQKMLLNILIDFLIGVTPVLGDILDMYWKCNLRNIKLLEQELLRR
ncbi:MAG: DUF4112 domain-containing protein [Bdellovibrionales bacterium]|nr:DUF4112 domain-containing protein [Bdellovibrionales bacterium]